MVLNNRTSFRMTTPLRVAAYPAGMLLLVVSPLLVLAETPRANGESDGPSVIRAAQVTGRTKNPREQEKKSTDFELTIREGNGAYGTAAYSFRFSAQSLRVHRNLVDLVYNRCGNLHVNAHGGMKSRIADLGVVSFDEVDTAPKKGWKVDCVRPQKGHVFVQEINDRQQKAYVKFTVTAVERNGTLKVKWSPLKSNEDWPHFRRGGAGTMGQCGGFHRER